MIPLPTAPIAGWTRRGARAHAIWSQCFLQHIGVPGEDGIYPSAWCGQVLTAAPLVARPLLFGHHPPTACKVCTAGVNAMRRKALRKLPTLQVERHPSERLTPISEERDRAALGAPAPRGPAVPSALGELVTDLERPGEQLLLNDHGQIMPPDPRSTP